MSGPSDEVPISHLQRRQIEGRVLIPFIEASRAKFGDAATRELVSETIRHLAADDGARWRETFGGDIGSLRSVVENVWAGGGSLDVAFLDPPGDGLNFNVTRCRYAEFYQSIGLAELGYQLHCARDYAMIAGFNPDLALTRTQTVMRGAAHCDFRFRARPEAEGGNQD